MFTRQASETPRILMTALHWKRGALAGVAGLCLLSSVYFELHLLRLALVLFGSALGYFAFRPHGLHARMEWQVAFDPDHAFITNAENCVQHCNPMAIGRFGDCIGRDLAEVFENLIADPTSLLSRMRCVAGAQHACKEYIMTRRAHFRLRLTQIAPDLLLWRLDELGGIDALKGEGLSVPLIAVASDGVISYKNKAFRDLYGAAANSLTDLFDHQPLEAAKPLEMNTASGRTSVVVAEIKGHAGRRDIIVMPAPQKAPAKRAIGVGWDAIEDLPVPLLKISATGDVLASNREARQLLGVDAVEGQHVADLFDGLGRPIADWLREASEGRGSQVSQFLRGRGARHDTFVQVTLNMAGTQPGFVAQIGF